MKRLCMAVAAGLAAAPLLAGCSWFSPMTTGLDYQAGDGREFTKGELAIRNAMVVAGEDGTTGAVVATLVNTGEDSISVDFGDAGPKFDVPAGKLIKVSPVQKQQVTVTGKSVRPAGYVKVPFNINGQEEPLELPIVGSNFPRYATLTPGPDAGKPAETKTVKPSVTDTSTPDADASATASPSASE